MDITILRDYLILCKVIKKDATWNGLKKFYRRVKKC